ncbi:MAG: glycoside hydrolase family 78 protein [Planctomycetota bacterium]|nr:glycoside hydrolase family 78 protein [Planctomycetota bacterium]
MIAHTWLRGCLSAWISVLVFAFPAHAAIEPTGLRCEYRTNPQGIDVASPRLSWIVQATAAAERGQRQTAYHILVASKPQLLLADQGDLWDTGKVASSQAVHVAYAGQPLTSRLRCYWKVQLWDKDEKASLWSPPAAWSMGLLEAADWQAEWIGAQVTMNQATGPYLPCIYLRKQFQAPKPVLRATLYATAAGVYELSVNGQRVGRDYFTPGWTEYDKRIYYQTYDVTGLLRTSGENVLGAILGDGWYGLHHNGRGKLALLAQLHLDYADGTSEIVATDESWKATTDGPLLMSDIYQGESYDARKEMPKWNNPWFADRDWTPVVVETKAQSGAEVAAPTIATAVRQAHPGVPVRKTQEIKTVTVTEPKPGNFVFDLGQNFSGWARLKVKGEAGTQVTLRFAEMLNPDGTVYTANLRAAKCTDTYLLKGGSGETWEPRFTFHGFRYVEVTGYPGKPTAEAITGVVLNSDAPLVSSFECSNPMLNQLYRNIVWSQRSNYLEVPTDCPQRDERMGWSGDAQAFLGTGTYNMDLAAFFTSWLFTFNDSQDVEGGYPNMAPRGGGVSPGWGDAGVICPWTLYRMYGDKRVIEQHYAGMARWIEYLEKRSQNYLRPAEGFGDWLNVGAEMPKDVLATAYFAYSANLMVKLARAIDQLEDAARYDHLFQQIKAAFHQAYVADDGRIQGHTQTTYLMALGFDLLPPEQRPQATAHLLKLIDERDGHLSTGFLGANLLLPTLTEVGRLDVAYRLLQNETYPSWGYPVKLGATTIWERWNGWTEQGGFQDPGMNSFNHYAYGSCGQWMFSTLAGIDTDGPGFERILIRPRPGGGITETKASYDSIHGRIATAWQQQGAELLLQVSLPANTTATVFVPATAAANVTEGGQPADQADGVRFLRREAGAAVYEVVAGNYAFVSQGP